MCERSRLGTHWLVPGSSLINDLNASQVGSSRRQHAVPSAALNAWGAPLTPPPSGPDNRSHRSKAILVDARGGIVGAADAAAATPPGRAGGKQRRQRKAAAEQQEGERAPQLLGGRGAESHRAAGDVGHR